VRKLLTFAAVVEIATGLAMLADPALVVTLLAGTGDEGSAMPLALFPGIVLVALGIACWPGRQAGTDDPAFRGMFFYNSVVAVFLAYLFFVEHLAGILLWPGLILHAIVAVLLVSTRNKT
jgi:hypothetical protein